MCPPACVCWQLYVLCASHALVQATVGVGTVIRVYIGVAYTRGGRGICFRLPSERYNPPCSQRRFSSNHGPNSLCATAPIFHNSQNSRHCDCCALCNHQYVLCNCTYNCIHFLVQSISTCYVGGQAKTSCRAPATCGTDGLQTWDYQFKPLRGLSQYIRSEGNKATVNLVS